MNKISLCMIVKNEGGTVGKAIDSCLPFIDEAIIGIDSSTTDNTREEVLAAIQHMGNHATVYTFDWKDDFAAARNEAIGRASGDLIFILDGHEWVSAKSYEQLEDIKKDRKGFDVFQANLVMHDANDDESWVMQIRLFAKEYRYKNAIHNQLDITDDHKVAHLTKVFVHHKRTEQNAAERKKQRDELNPDALIERYGKTKDPKVLTLIGNAYMSMKEWATAVGYFRAYLADNNGNARERYQVHLHLSKCLYFSGDIKGAEKVLIPCLNLKVGRNEHLVFLGELYHLQGDSFRCIYYLTLATNYTLPVNYYMLYPAFYRDKPWKLLRREYEKIGFEQGVKECNKVLNMLSKDAA